jgi:hypothetical protein
MKKIALAFVALTVLVPVLGLAAPVPLPSSDPLLLQIFAPPAPSSGGTPAPQLMTTCPGPTCDEMDGNYCEAKGTCYTGPSCVPVGCFCFQNSFICP